MQTIKLLKGQSLIDIAIQEYCNIEAIPEIISLNQLEDIDVTASLKLESLIIDKDSKLVKKKYLSELNNKKILS
ncbi:MAG: hypothetical protein N4A49_06755 [Marinifilaceae bacterium]|jgi:hypothetical protein|nr:hypothetical protein [Marinifilaceae bacterium]